jgi:DNA-directed RNA polymerase III subunit RPC1
LCFVLLGFCVVLLNRFEQAAVSLLSGIARLSARFLSELGFSIGINDVFASSELQSKKQDLIVSGDRQCVDLIRKHRSGLLSVDELEVAIQTELSSVREKAGKACTEQLSKQNAALVMSNCGSKVLQ